MRLLIVSLIASVTYAAATPPDQALLDWVTGSGGNIAQLVLGRSCPSCLRGALASRSFEAGEVVAQIPANSSIALGQGSTAEAALQLLQRLDRDAAFAAAFQPYLAALPGPDEVLSPETLSEAAIEELQTPELAHLVRQRLAALQEAHLQLGGGGSLAPSLDRLRHMAAVVHTRAVNLLGGRRLVPALDMLNHSEQPNTRFAVDGGTKLLLVATRAIQAGEELSVAYKAAGLRRPDAALFQYGFLPPAAGGADGQPLLCAVDLPVYRRSNPWRQTDAADDRYVPSAAGSWLSDWALLREHARLSALLAAMPTSEEEDRRLLQEAEGGGSGAWQHRLLLQFRLQRKVALRAALARMEAAWRQAHGRSPADGRGGSSRVPSAAAAAAAALHGARWFLLSGRWQEPDVVALLLCVAAALFLSRR